MLNQAVLFFGWQDVAITIAGEDMSSIKEKNLRYMYIDMAKECI